jgi:TPR repeat protein
MTTILNTDWKFVEANLPDSDEERTDLSLAYIAYANENGNSNSKNNNDDDGGSGVDTKPYMEVAFKLLLKITEGGAKVSTAYANLGTIYAYGMGVTEIDYAKAHANFTRAYAMGDRRVAHCIGLMHLFGNGVSMNVPEAIDWFKIAATDGHVMASIFNLAKIFGEGADGVAPDTDASEYLYAVCKEIRGGDASRATMQTDANAIPAVDKNGHLFPDTIARIKGIVPVSPLAEK